jgi:uncharacterized protein involved in exopolysaccharide biosynthesis
MKKGRSNSKALEAQLREKDRQIADLVARLLGSRERELEERIEKLEKAVAKWAAAALRGKVEIIPTTHLTTRSTRTRRKRRAG